MNRSLENRDDVALRRNFGMRAVQAKACGIGIIQFYMVRILDSLPIPFFHPRVYNYIVKRPRRGLINLAVPF